jgi:large subunit ribosomal protein L5
MAKEKAVAPPKEKKKVPPKKIIPEKDVIPYFYKRYYEEILPTLRQRLGYRNLLEVPRLEKITINMGVGEVRDNRAILEQVFNDLMMLTGQRPVITRARKAVAGFKIKRGMQIGLKVTLRRKRMFEFLNRLLATAVPRVRDFKGFNPNSFDKSGNFTFGIPDHTVFPEIDLSKVQHIQGMDITFCIICKKKEDALELLKEFGFPFREV